MEVIAGLHGANQAHFPAISDKFGSEDKEV